MGRGAWKGRRLGHLAVAIVLSKGHRLGSVLVLGLDLVEVGVVFSLVVNLG
jgi:hypothetical protein